MVQPVCPGKATAPYEYGRGSKKSKEALMAFNKTGLPLTAWADSSHSAIRFWGCEKKGFNRGNRVEDLTWTYSGGHTMTMCINQKDMVPTEYDGSIPLFLDKKVPTDDTMMQPFDVIRITIMPKNDDGLKKPKKSCFTLKSMGPTMRTMSSILPHLKETMCKSKDDAQDDAINLIRGDGKYRDSKGNLLPYAHQVDSMPPKEDKENYTASEVTTCSFLEENLGPEVTFMYDDMDSITIRMCVKSTGGATPYFVDMPRHAFLKNANAKDIHTAVGFYTLAAHSGPGALYAFVMHCRFWGNTLWDPSCLYGEATPYRGVPIVDVSKILTPLTRADFYMSSLLKIEGGEGKKARIIVPLGFKMPYVSSNTMEDDDEGEMKGPSGEMCQAMAEVAIVPRKVVDNSPNPLGPYSICTDMRLSPHGSVPMDLAYVMTIFLGVGETKHNILNLDYNGARDVGCVPVVAGKKHAWSAAVPSAIDDDEEDEKDEEEKDAKRMKKAMDSVA